MPSVTAVVLAGGRGTRIAALYPDLPKPLVPVNGLPFLHWVTAFLARNGVRDFVYSTGYLGEQIEAWCQAPVLPGLRRRVCHESQPLGTGGGVLNCLDLCGDWVLVANGDSLCLEGISALLALTVEAGLSGGLVGVSRPDTARYGSLQVDAAHRLTRFLEKMPGEGHINAGTYLFRADVLRALPCGAVLSMEHDVIPRLLADGGLLRAILVQDAPFIDMGTPETVAEASAFIARHRDRFSWPA